MSRSQDTEHVRPQSTGNALKQDAAPIWFNNKPYDSWERAYNAYESLSKDAKPSSVWPRLRAKRDKPDDRSSPFRLNCVDCGKSCQLRNPHKWHKEHRASVCAGRCSKRAKLTGAAEANPCSGEHASAMAGHDSDVIQHSSYMRVHGRPSRAPATWIAELVVCKERLQEVLYHKAEGEGIVKITINRPEKRNAFTPRTVQEMAWCMSDARDDPRTGVVILTGAGTEAFCSGGDQSVRGEGGYIGADGVPRLNVLDLQMQIRRLPKPVICMVAGYAVGGGHILHMVCDLTISADNGIFGQTGPKVGSFDAGYGSTQMVRLIGQKRAREMWFLARLYTAKQALDMGLINKVVPLAELEAETLEWSREIMRNSPTAIRALKAAMNAAEDGQAGIQELGHNLTMMFYQSEEGSEGRKAYLQQRPPDFSKFPRLP